MMEQRGAAAASALDLLFAWVEAWLARAIIAAKPKFRSVALGIISQFGSWQADEAVANTLAIPAWRWKKGAFLLRLALGLCPRSLAIHRGGFC